MIFVDSNVLIDILDRDPQWYAWSFDRIADAAAKGGVAINHVVLAEAAPHFGDLTVFTSAIEEMMIAIEPLSDDGAYLSGKAFLDYRRRREGSRTVLPDFFVGGHAQALGATILTRDPRFYRAYFPSVPLITPDL